MFEECFVESWKRKIDDKGKEFISFKIILKSKELGEVGVERRYSEFHKLHTEILGWFGDGEMRSLLRESFPSKQFLSLQTDAFAEKRTRALDAYLQILTHCLRERKLLGHELILEFFGVKNFKMDSNVVSNSVNGRVNIKSPVIKTPNALNSEIENLRLKMHTSKDLKSLKNDFNVLQEAILEKSVDEKLREKFYEVKREWEVMRIRSGEQYEGFNDDIFTKAKHFESETKCVNTQMYSNHPTTTLIPVAGDAKHHLREQEAILSDLADTLQQQKQLSLEICEEILEQNRAIGVFGQRQEGTIGEFLQSTERARKLQ